MLKQIGQVKRDRKIMSVPWGESFNLVKSGEIEPGARNLEESDQVWYHGIR
jgi:hypothetical protein